MLWCEVILLNQKKYRRILFTYALLSMFPGIPITILCLWWYPAIVWYIAAIVMLPWCIIIGLWVWAIMVMLWENT